MKNNKNFILLLIGMIRDNVNKFLTTELKKFDLKGISPSHGDIIGILCFQDKIKMNELASSINRDKSTVTALVKKLIDLEYVKKVADEKDSRITLVTLSEKGKKIKPEILQISENLRTKAYKGLSEEEKKILVMLLSKVLNNFK